MGKFPQPNLNDYVSKIIRYKARKLVGQFGFTVSDQEDTEQELALHLIEHAEQIGLEDVHKTVLNRILDHRLVSILRHRRAQCRDLRRNKSLELEFDEGVFSGEELGDEQCLRTSALADLEIDVNDAMELLDADVRCTCELLKHHSIVETAHRLGLTRGKTRTQLAKMRALLTGAGLEVYVDD